MQQNVNYQKKLDKLIEGLNGKRPSLLLHACCAPCSSYVLEYLSKYFNITFLFYNPNITYQEEYDKRAEELKRLVREMGLSDNVSVIVAEHNPAEFYVAAKGLEKVPEGGERCYKCYELRLLATAKLAKELKMDYFTTTLSISPLKNAAWLNEIGDRLSKEYGVYYLYSDFKKKNGYKRSIELSKEYNLYRQDYCGCIYSKTQREEEKNKDNKSFT